MIWYGSRRDRRSDGKEPIGMMQQNQLDGVGEEEEERKLSKIEKERRSIRWVRWTNETK